MEKTPDNFNYGNMTADFRTRYKKMLEEKNRKKVDKKKKSYLKSIIQILT